MTELTSCLEAPNAMFKENTEACKDINGPDATLVEKPKNRRIYKKRVAFSWDKYLETHQALGCPTDCFPHCVQSVSVSLKFKEGMKMESIDPKNPALFCIVTVMERKSFRLRMNFDGYAPCYDFLCNASSHFLLPINWCKRHGKDLQPPKGYNSSSWDEYSNLHGQTACFASDDCFQNVPSSEIELNKFAIEALDTSNEMRLVLVKENIGHFVLVEFQGPEVPYLRWFSLSSPCIKPFGWSKSNGLVLHDSELLLNDFSLAPLPSCYFKPAPDLKFEKNWKLEAVDQWNPILIRVCTIIDIFILDGIVARLKLRMDSWTDDFAFWVDADSEEIYPPGFCSTVGYPLTVPNEFLGPAQGSSCPTVQCRGQGHVKGPRFLTHHNAAGCPYSLNKLQIPDRLSQNNNSLSKPSPTGSITSTNSNSSQISPNIVSEVETKGKLIEDDGLNSTSQVSKDPNLHIKEEILEFCDAENNKIKLDNASCLVGEIDSVSKNDSLLNSTLDISTESLDSDVKPPKQLKLEPEIPEINSISDDDKAIKRELQERVNVSVLKVAKKETNSTREPREISTHVDKPRKPRFCCGGNRADFDHNEDLLERAIYNSVFGLPSEGRYTELALCSKHRRKLMPTVTRSEIPVANWSPEQVGEFVDSIPSCDGQVFIKEQIDGEAFLLLTQSDIVKLLSVKTGPALKIYHSIQILQNYEDKRSKHSSSSSTSNNSCASNNVH